MYISVWALLWGLLGLLGAIAIIVLIIALVKLIKLISNINDILSSNRNNIDKLCSSLPTISDNLVDISDNVKDVSEVITETTADVIVAKDSITGNFETIKDILNIIINTFIKK